MEACCGAHHLGRILVAQGHDVRLIPPQYVKPFVKSQKNDLLDAEAIGEAVQRPTMRFVPLKTMEQLDLQAIHRLRTRLVARRTAVINQMRGFLLERGVTFPIARRALVERFPEVLDNPALGLSVSFCRLLQQLRDEWRLLEPFKKPIRRTARVLLSTLCRLVLCPRRCFKARPATPAATNRMIRSQLMAAGQLTPSVARPVGPKWWSSTALMIRESESISGLSISRLKAPRARQSAAQ
jgi:hypothetical protein